MADTPTDRETGTTFDPKFDAAGLIVGIVTDRSTKAILMVAFMDREALEATCATGLAHFHSRSRNRLWCKGETSGNVLRVQRILVDCDQDALILECDPAGPACHTGEISCFYRALEDGALVRIASGS